MSKPILITHITTGQQLHFFSIAAAAHFAGVNVHTAYNKHEELGVFVANDWRFEDDTTSKKVITRKCKYGPVVRINVNTGEREIFETLVEAANATGCTYVTVYLHVHGKRNSSRTGYRFYLAEDAA